MKNRNYQHITGRSDSQVDEKLLNQRIAVNECSEPNNCVGCAVRLFACDDILTAPF